MEGGTPEKSLRFVRTKSYTALVSHAPAYHGVLVSPAALVRISNFVAKSVHSRRAPTM